MFDKFDSGLLFLLFIFSLWPHLKLMIFWSYLNFYVSLDLGKVCLILIRKIQPQHFVPSPQKPKVCLKREAVRKFYSDVAIATESLE